jgi:hypothetical protein
MDDLIAFLRIRLDDDEQAARSVAPFAHTTDMAGRRMDESFVIARALPAGGDGSWSQEPDPAAARHFARHDPARVRADVAAKRTILELHEPYGDKLRMARGEISACGTCGSVDDSPVEWPCDTVLALALPYADHPDYREEWRP